MNQIHIYSTNEPTMGQTATTISELATNGLYGLSNFTPTKDCGVPSNGFILPDGSIVQINSSADVLKLYQMIDARDLTAFRLRTGIITVNSLLDRDIYSIGRQPSNKQLYSLGLMSENSNNKICANFGGLDGYSNYDYFLRDVINMYPPVKKYD